MQRLGRTTYLSALAADGAALGAAAAAVDLSTAVPSCPGWTVADLVRHTGQVHRHKSEIVARGRLTDPPQEGALPPPGADLLRWYAEGLAELVEVLRRPDPAQPVWTWFPAERTVGFWQRRMAQETLVHRVDAELAAGAVGPVDPAMAVDGIDEVIDRMLTGDWGDEAVPGSVGTVRVATGEESWRVLLSPQAVWFDRTAGPVDAEVTGSAGDVLLWLWGRGPVSAMSVRGDPAAAERLRERLARAT